jgi:hypothetical protein
VTSRDEKKSPENIEDAKSEMWMQMPTERPQRSIGKKLPEHCPQKSTANILKVVIRGSLEKIATP